MGRVEHPGLTGFQSMRRHDLLRRLRRHAGKAALAIRYPHERCQESQNVS